MDGPTVVRNATVLLSTSLFARFLVFGFNILLARYLGVEQFGVYAFAISYVALLSVFVEFSLQQLVIRDVARNPDLAGYYFSNSLALKCVFFPAAVALIAITTKLLGYSREIQIVLYILSIGILFEAVISCCVASFNAVQKMHYSGALDIIDQICFTALGLTALLLGGGLATVVTCRVVAQAVTQVVGVIILTKKLRIRPQRVNYTTCKSLIKQARHFFAISFFTTTTRNLDTVLLMSMQGPAAAGIYAAAAKLMKITGYFSKAFSDAVYPVLSKQAILRDQAALAETYRQSLRWLMIAVVPFVVVATVQSENVMRILYGSGFIEASLVFQIFAWRTALGFLTQFCGTTLFALGQQATVFKATGTSTIASVLLYIVLIPRYSYTGAAFAVLATLLIEFMPQFFAVHQRLKTGFTTASVFKPVFAGIGMALFCAFFEVIPLVPLVGLGLLIYGGLLMVLGAISRDELQVFLRSSMALLQTRRLRRSISGSSLNP